MHNFSAAQRIHEPAPCGFIFFSSFSFSLSVRGSLRLLPGLSIIPNRHPTAFALLVRTDQPSIGHYHQARAALPDEWDSTTRKQGWLLFWRLWGYLVYRGKGLEGFCCSLLDESARSGTLSERFPACEAFFLSSPGGWSVFLKGVSVQRHLSSRYLKYRIFVTYSKCLFSSYHCRSPSLRPGSTTRFGDIGWLGRGAKVRTFHLQLRSSTELIAAFCFLLRLDSYKHLPG